jgi:hypothetical protein
MSEQTKAGKQRWSVGSNVTTNEAPTAVDDPPEDERWTRGLPAEELWSTVGNQVFKPEWAEKTRQRNPIETKGLVLWWLRQRDRLPAPWDSFPVLTMWQNVFVKVLANETRGGGCITKWQAIEAAERLHMNILHQYVFTEHVGAPEYDHRTLKESRLKYPSLITMGIVRVKVLLVEEERMHVYRISNRGIETADWLTRHGFSFRQMRRGDH